MAFVGTISPSLVSSGTTFAQLQAGGLSGVLERLITKQVATATPSAPTLSATSDASSTLPTATYYCTVTETNGFGESLPSTATSGQSITSGTNHLTVTFAALQTGATARNVYLSTSSTGPFLLAATGQTGTTATFTAPLPSNSYSVVAPTAASTAPTFTDALGNGVSKPLELIRGWERGNGQNIYRFAHDIVTNLSTGQPVNFAAAMTKLYHARAAALMLVQALNEIGTLIDANAGTLKSSQNPIGDSYGVRTQP